MAQLALTAILLASTFTTSQSASQRAPAAHQSGCHLHSKAIPNFGQVSPQLYRGGQPTAEGIEELHKIGVAVVVDLRGSASISEQAHADKLGMHYISIPSHCPLPTDEPFAKFLKVIRDNPGKKVFVHCRLGDDRTGMAVASYRMADEGWTAEEAMTEMKEFGFTGFHHQMCPGLASYEASFPERLKNNKAFEDLRPNKK